MQITQIPRQLNPAATLGSSGRTRGSGSSPARMSPHHLRRKERATAGSVEKMATGMARSLVGRFSGRFATT